MFNQNIRILNFDASVIRQPGVLKNYNPEIIELSDLGPKARLWTDKKTGSAIEERLRGLSESSITFLGSGDFHHISSILTDRFDAPFSLIVFDFHPDWDILPPKFGCGSWVTRALKNKNIAKCVLAGVSSSDISSGWIQNGNLGALRDNRVEIYPYSHKPSRVFFRPVPENVSLNIKRDFLGSKIYWTELRGKDLADFFLSLVRRLPAKRVYVSIDKDCLREEYALTNWEKGLFSLEELLKILKIIKENLEIIGVDIVGDYSYASFDSRLKAFFSAIDHPKDIAASRFSDSFINATNQNTNLRILETLTV
jgi:hypothetical protein